MAVALHQKELTDANEDYPPRRHPLPDRLLRTDGLRCRQAQDNVTQAAIETLQYATNGNPYPLDYQQQFDVDALAGVQAIPVATPGGQSYALTPDDGIESKHWEYDSPAYASLTALRRVYATGTYTLTIYYPNSVTDTAVLGFNPQEPSSFIQPTYPAANATNVPSLSALTITWAQDTADSNCMMEFELADPSGNTIAKAGLFPMATVSWTPLAALAPSTQYDFQLSVFGEDAATTGTQTTVGGNSFQYYGVFGNINNAMFTTAAVPEPGTLFLLAAGVAAWWLWRRLRPVQGVRLGGRRPRFARASVAKARGRKRLSNSCCGHLPGV